MFFVTFLMLYPTVSKFSIFADFEILVTGTLGMTPTLTSHNFGQVHFRNRFLYVFCHVFDTPSDVFRSFLGISLPAKQVILERL